MSTRDWRIAKYEVRKTAEFSEVLAGDGRVDELSPAGRDVLSALSQGILVRPFVLLPLVDETFLSEFVEVWIKPTVIDFLPIDLL